MSENASQGEYVEEADFLEEGEGGFLRSVENLLESRYFLALIIVLVALIAFFLGVFWNARSHKEPLRVYNSSAQNVNLNGSMATSSGDIDLGIKATENAAGAALAPTGGEGVVASKNGTKYHYPWCAGAKQISEKNKVTFSSIEEARAKGYTPAANCKGLK